MSERNDNFENGSSQELASQPELTELENIASGIVTREPGIRNDGRIIPICKPGNALLAYMTLSETTGQTDISPITKLSIVEDETSREIVLFEHHGLDMGFYVSEADQDTAIEILQSLYEQADSQRAKELSRCVQRFIQPGQRYNHNHFSLSFLIEQVIAEYLVSPQLTREFFHTSTYGDLCIVSLEKIRNLATTPAEKNGSGPEELNIYFENERKIYNYSSGGHPAEMIVFDPATPYSEVVKAQSLDINTKPKSCDIAFLIERMIDAVTPNQKQFDAEWAEFTKSPPSSD